MHATIPKGNMGYDQYTVPDDCSCRVYLWCFPLALANICPWLQLPFFQISLKKSELKTTDNTFWDCRVHFSDNLSRNSCIWPQKRNGAIGLHQNKESIYRSKPGNVLPFCHSLKSELLMKLLPTRRGIIAVIKPPVTWENSIYQDCKFFRVT